MPSFTKQDAVKFWELCNKYLCKKTDINAVKILSKAPMKKESIAEFYKRLLESLRNRQGMPRTIVDIERLRGILLDFDPRLIHPRFQNWETLYKEISAHIKHLKPLEETNPKSYWVVFCKGAIDGALFFNQFESAGDFIRQVDTYAENEIMCAGFPQLLTLTIHGLGFPLACDFIKESGWHQYAKADVHTKGILKEIGFTNGEDYDTFRAIQMIAKYVGETPFAVDKHIWLIGTGEINNEKFKTGRNEFLKFYRANINPPD